LNMIGKGCVIAIGGNEDKSGGSGSLLGEFVARAGGADARIVIIPTASAEPERRAAQYVNVFTAMGAGQIHVLNPERGITRDGLMLIENATGIFVTGGDQVKLMQHLRKTACADAIVNAVRRGAVYCGTSAGASAVSKKMLFGARQDGSGLIDVAEGLGLIPGVIVDQHFSERQRLPRLLEAVETHGLHGLGVDENTAIVWEAGRARVRGASRVTVVDPDAAIRIAAEGEELPL